MVCLAEERRKEMNLSQDKIAAKSGISRQYYNAIVRNRKTPSVDTAKVIASVLNIDWTIFFEDKVNG